jgi:hypothetical protein
MTFETFFEKTLLSSRLFKTTGSLLNPNPRHRTLGRLGNSGLGKKNPGIIAQKYKQDKTPLDMAIDAVKNTGKPHLCTAADIANLQQKYPGRFDINAMQAGEERALNSDQGHGVKIAKTTQGIILRR